MPHSPAASAENLLRQAAALVRRELASVDRAIAARLTSDIELIHALAAHITAAGGKRLRPLIVLLSANCSGRESQSPHRVTLAAVIEFIHTATLLHDDVVDASSLRRGRATANQVWGNEASVLVGDFLYSRAFEMILETENLTVMRILAATTNAIAEGEVMQLSNRGAADLTESQYMETIRRKTAKLFAAAAAIGATIGGGGDAQTNAFAAYGLALGTAFQLVDDIFDYAADGKTIGKNIGDDLAEGKLTLPLIRALQTCDAVQRRIIQRAIQTRARDQVHAIRDMVESLGALEYTYRQAETFAAAAAAALAEIPPSAYKDALLGLAEYALRRRR